MKAYKFIAVLALLMVIPCLSASAGDGDYPALPFVRSNPNPGSAGMAGGIVNASAYSSFSNTAAVTFWDKTLDVGAGWSMADNQSFSLGAAWKLGKVALAIGGTYGLGDKYEVYDSNGAENGTFTTNNMNFNLGVAWRFVDFLSIGADFKYLSNKLATDYTASAFAADVFLMTKLSDFRIALGVSSIGTSVKDDAGNSFSLPTSITLGAGYDHTFGKHGLNVALDLDYYYDNSDFTGSIGAEYNYNKYVFVRAGYHYAEETSVIPSYASVGIGGQIIGIRLDVSYNMMLNGYAKDCLMVGLAYSF